MERLEERRLRTTRGEGESGYHENEDDDAEETEDEENEDDDAEETGDEEET